MGTVVMNGSVSVDGFIADENDDPDPLFDWLVSGDVPLDDSGVLLVSQASYDHIRPYWDRIAVTIAGRHVFDITDGWDGTPPSGVDHVVVTHRPAPEGWDLGAPFRFVDSVEAAVSMAKELAGTASSRSPPAMWAGRCSPQGWSTRCAWTWHPSCSARGSATSARSTRSTCSRARMSWCWVTGCCICAIAYVADQPSGCAKTHLTAGAAARSPRTPRAAAGSRRRR